MELFVVDDDAFAEAETVGDGVGEPLAHAFGAGAGYGFEVEGIVVEDEVAEGCLVEGGFLAGPAPGWVGAGAVVVGAFEFGVVVEGLAEGVG